MAATDRYSGEKSKNKKTFVFLLVEARIEETEEPAHRGLGFFGPETRRWTQEFVCLVVFEFVCFFGGRELGGVAQGAVVL